MEAADVIGVLDGYDACVSTLELRACCRPTETGAGPSDARIAAAASHFREHGLHGAWVMVSVRIVDPLSGTRAGS